MVELSESLVLGAAWVLGVGIMSYMLIALMRAGYGFRKALTHALITGKVIATIYWVAGLDRPVMTITYVRGGTVAGVTLTANTIILMSLLAANIVNNAESLKSYLGSYLG